MKYYCTKHENAFYWKFAKKLLENRFTLSRKKVRIAI